MASDASSTTFKYDFPPSKQPQNPGTVGLRRIERINDVFMITLSWVDMLGFTHEGTFERGDFYTNFSKVLKVMTDTGLPIDPDKVEEFRISLCKVWTSGFPQTQQKPPVTPQQNQENKSPTTEEPKA